MRLVPLALAIIVARVAADDVTNPLSLCSSENTGTEMHFSIYNSYGSCTQQCAGHAFAIVQGQNCWCSDTAPASTVDTSKCSDACPGFKSDRCGNQGEGLYGYAQIGNAKSTAGGSSSVGSSTSSGSSAGPSSASASSSDTSSSESSTSSQSSSTSPSSSSSPSSASSSSPSSSSVSSSTASSSPSSSSTASSTESKSTSQSPSVLVSTVTVTGQVRTITPSSSPTTDGSSGSSSTSASANTASAVDTGKQKKNGQGFWHNHGAVAGTFAAVGIVVVALLALVLFCCCRRRRQQASTRDGFVGGVPAGADADSNRTRQGGGTSTHRTHESSPHSQKHMGDSFNFDDQETQLVPIFDQRVDPTQMYMRWEKTASQQSLQDNHDYSRRVLRVANPGKDY